MMIFDLPATDVEKPPSFSSADECRNWLGEQTLTNPSHMQGQLHDQVELLNHHVVPLRERFGILETLQKQVVFVQEEVSRRYAAKALPFLKTEAEAFSATCGLWDAVATGYLRCLEDAITGSASDRTLTTLIQRALATLFALQLDRVRGYAQPDAAHWKRLHQLLALAESRGLVGKAVKDKQHYGEGDITPLAVYAEAMLLHAAGAHELSARPLTWVVRWARRWGGKLVLLTNPPADLQAVPLNVDLASSLPPSPLPHKTETARFLDTGELSKSIRSRLALLAEGRTPAELQLGDDCTQPDCEQLLQRLYQRWCKGGMQRPTDRHAATGKVDIVAGPETIWFHLSGKPFKQPRVKDDAILRREREELATFGRISDRHETTIIDSQMMRIESHWQVVNEGPAGLRLMREMSPDAVRIGVGQLIAVRRAGASSFTLASVRWLMADGHTCMHAGINLIAGVATPVSFRNAGLNAAKETWRPAFVLSTAESGMPSAVVLPGGVFRPDRTIDLEGADWKQLKLKSMIERGDDFERVALS
jgi:hypothetical protein